MKKNKFKVIVIIIIVVLILSLIYSLSRSKVDPVNSVKENTILKGKGDANINPKFREQLNRLKGIIEKDTNDVKSLLNLAGIFQDAHQPEEAIKYYEKGLKNDPMNNEARIDYSLCLYELGKTKESMLQNMIVMKYDPMNIQALFNLGSIYGNEGNKDSAKFYWSLLISKYPDSSLSIKAKENLKILMK